MTEDDIRTVEVEIVRIVKRIDYSTRSVFQVEINLKNMYQRFRKLEIGVCAFSELGLGKNSKIIVYENPKKSSHFKIHYRDTFALYGKKHFRYYDDKK